MHTSSMRMTACLAVFTLAVAVCRADDWTQFRGANGAGISSDTKIPVRWSDKENLRWKTELPGPGSSSPIVAGDHVFVTCYSGYGIPKSSGGSVQSLQRHLVCVSRQSGDISWSKSVSGEQREDGYQGYITEHGYASNTPVTDGERVYCFFGKSGVVAFDLYGKQLWITNVGTESSNRRWGSAASLILYKDFVIVNASEESQSIRALDKRTGEEKWKAVGSILELAYGTPALITLGNKTQELVVAAPEEIWGLNPDTGRMLWYCSHQLTGNICPSVIASGDTAYIFGGFRSAGSVAVKAGGTKDVTKSHVKWTGRNSSYVATPVLHDGRLFWINDQGQACCIDAKTGELIYRERVTEIEVGGRPVYASPVLADGRIYVPTRWNGVLVLATGAKYKVLAQNRFAADESDFNATPAISNGDLFLRSNRYLYCVAARK